MCCFTGDIRLVSGTRIFARMRGERELLIYQMTYGAARELAMVLPIPVRPGTGEAEVRFIDLTGCEDLFEHLAEGFLDSRDLRGGNVEFVLDAERAPVLLQVQKVGAYEASFVPTPADFGRLDARFRLPADLWTRLGLYANYGFAVFKLRDVQEARVHPMAFEFPTRHTDRLFFPTLHIHHGELEPVALFDHVLYCQPEPAMNWHLQGWDESDRPIGELVRCQSARALFDLELPCWAIELKRRRVNTDAWLGPGPGLPRRAS